MRWRRWESEIADAQNVIARIADRIESNRETVKKRLQRARARLLDCLTRKGILDDPTPEMSP